VSTKRVWPGIWAWTQEISIPAPRRFLPRREKDDFLAALGENGLKTVSAPNTDARGSRQIPPLQILLPFLSFSISGNIV